MDLSNFCVDQKTFCQYELIGFILKKKLNYTCVLKKDNRWLHYQDSIIEKVDDFSLKKLKNNSVICLYRKKSENLFFMKQKWMENIYSSKFSDIIFK
jgi:hypothetical protein